jgi:hypothetical protein
MSQKQKYSELGAGEMKEILYILRHILRSIISDAVFTRTGHQTKARKTRVLCHGNPSFERTPLPWLLSSLRPGEKCTANRGRSDRRKAKNTNNLTPVFSVQNMQPNIAKQLRPRSGTNFANVAFLHTNWDNFVYYWLQTEGPRFDPH